MAQHDALQTLLTETSLALSRLRAVNTPERAVSFLRDLGYEIPAAAIGPTLPALAAEAGGLTAAVGQLANAEGSEAVGTALVAMFGRMDSTVDAIRALRAELQSTSASIPHIEELPRRLTDFLLLDHLERQHPQLHDTLHLFGLIERVPAPQPGQPSRLVNWERFGLLFQEPSRIADEVYRWNTDFDSDTFLQRLFKVMQDEPLPGGLYSQADTTRAALGNTSSLQELRFPIFQRGFTPETYAQFGIAFAPADAQGGKKKGLALLPYLMGASGFDFAVCDRGELKFESTADIRGVGLVVRPPFDADPLLNLQGAFRAAVRIAEKPERAEEMVLIGSAGGSRLAVQGLGITWFAQNPQGRLDVGVEGQIQAIRLVLGGKDGDGFLQKILSGLDVHAEASLTLGITLLNGFTVQGSGQLAIEVSTPADLGPVKIDSLRLAIAPAADQIAMDAGAVLRLQLGPLRAVVENVGLHAALRFDQGNLGPADVETSFKPPAGVGLSIESALITGGGFLSFDPVQGQYAGALQLAVGDMFTLNAVGLITTRMPDGSAGFSLLLVITAEFAQGIQLGFGFTLLGVGGLLGLNRTVRLQALIDGVRSRAVEGIMFPKDVLANAPRIVNDLATFFPPREGTFLIGPMAKIGWGTPVLVRITLGIVAEIPGNIVALGVVQVTIPNPQAPLILLQVSFAGALEFDRRRLFFFAALFESRIGFLTIEGEMGLLVSFGAGAAFVLTVGGFHPRFIAPALPFPRPNRITAPLFNSPAARVNAECYVAVTSNTVQFGGRLEVFFGFKSFNVQGHLSFDALFQFSPFHFTVDIATSLSVKVFGAGLFSVKIRGTLDGPAPWHIEGHGSISLLFWDLDVDFSKTWGESRNTVLPPISVFPLLVGELTKAENWRALLPPANRLLVSVRSRTTAADLVLHPLGALQVSQRALPLGVIVDKVGSQRIADVNQLTIDPASGLTRQGDAFESFAPAQFRELSDADKLSKPAFTLERSGLVLSSGADLQSSGMAKRNIRYEEIVIDSNFKRFARPFSGYATTLFNFFARNGSSARTELSQATRAGRQPFAATVAVTGETFTVAFVATNKAVGEDATSFDTESSAREYLNRRITADPSLAGSLHVIPTVERAA
jgi:hypothetical protein